MPRLGADGGGLREWGGELVFASSSRLTSALYFLTKKAKQKMHSASAEKLAYNKYFYESNKDKKQLIDTIRSTLEGQKSQAKTLENYGWTMTKVNRIRALNLVFRLLPEDNHRFTARSWRSSTGAGPRFPR